MSDGRNWTRAASSKADNACVELARDGDSIVVRNSRRPEVEMSYTVTEIAAFIHGAKLGEFDHLLDGKAPLQR